MKHQTHTPLTPRASNFLAERYAPLEVAMHTVDGGYSRNRRAIVAAGKESLFAKEVDTSVLEDDGAVELGWLNKDYAVVTELRRLGLDIVPDWAELQLDGHLLLLPSYRQADGWWWTVPEDESLRTKYTQAVVDATKRLEAVALPDSLVESLSLQPFFRDELAQYDGIQPILDDAGTQAQLIDKYSHLRDQGGHLAPMHAQMLETLRDDFALRELQQHTIRLSEQPNDCFNHCDVRSDNIAYHEQTGEVKFVDWNWASYAPAKFGATEFIVDMARRGADVSPWYGDIDGDQLAAMVGYYMIRCLREPLFAGSTLRGMQAETAAVANWLYREVSML